MGTSTRRGRLANGATPNRVSLSNHTVQHTSAVRPSRDQRSMVGGRRRRTNRTRCRYCESTSLHNAFGFLQELDSQPDNIFLITDGLPTQGQSAPRRNTVSGPARLKHYRDALRKLPSNVPVNVVLSPMEGDPAAASEFWKLAQETGGSFMAPAEDWP